MPSATVSVIIPCFNQGRFLADALDSVFAQTLSPHDVVVIDDGSTDRTASIAGSYPGVACVRQPNRGLAHARNRGLAAARGDYLVFLDADDRLLPDALAVGVKELMARPSCGVVFGRCERIDERGRRLPTVAPPPIAGDMYAALLRNNVIWAPALAMFRRDVCAPYLYFDPKLEASADYDLYLRLARSVRVEGHGRLVAEYRLHDGGMSRDPGVMLRSTVRVLRAQRVHLSSHSERSTAYEYGLRSFRHHYASMVADRMSRSWRTPQRWGAWLRDLGLLVRYYPGGVLRGVGRWLGRWRWIEALTARRAGARARA